MRGMWKTGVLILFLGLFCTKNESPLESLLTTDGSGKLSIETERTVYSWQRGESDKYIILLGTLKSDEEDTLYSQMGDGFGGTEQDQLFVAANSAGHVENYDPVEKEWRDLDITLLLIEGSRFVPIRPDREYMIYAHLAVNSNNEEKGQFRIRVDYYSTNDPGSDAVPFYDYSNVFVIR